MSKQLTKVLYKRLTCTYFQLIDLPW